MIERKGRLAAYQDGVREQKASESATTALPIRRPGVSVPTDRPVDVSTLRFRVVNPKRAGEKPSHALHADQVRTEEIPVVGTSGKRKDGPSLTLNKDGVNEDPDMALLGSLIRRFHGLPQHSGGPTLDADTSYVVDQATLDARSIYDAGPQVEAPSPSTETSAAPVENDLFTDYTIDDLTSGAADALFGSAPAIDKLLFDGEKLPADTDFDSPIFAELLRNKQAQKHEQE